MVGMYRKALNYAHKLDYDNHMDLVHDAYVEWWNKTQTNLFECHEGVVIQTVKNIHRSNYTRSTFMWRGVVYNKMILSYNKYDEDQSNPDLLIEVKYKHHDKIDPCSILIADDLESQLTDSLNDEQKEIYNAMKEGYVPSEIAKDRGTYRQQINYKVRAIASKFSTINGEGSISTS